MQAFPDAGFVSVTQPPPHVIPDPQPISCKIDYTSFDGFFVPKLNGVVVKTCGREVLGAERWYCAEPKRWYSSLLVGHLAGNGQLNGWVK